MPLCTLEIPREQYEALGVEKRNQAAIDICDAALTQTLDGLEIPDPDDREWRILVRDGIKESRLSISFTLDGDEYRTGTIFKPSAEKIHGTGVAIFRSAQESAFRISQVTMEPWSETTFSMREEEEKEDLAAPAAFENGAGREVGQPVVRLVVAVEALRSYQQHREREPAGEMGALEVVVSEMAGAINETLGLPENRVRHEVVVADMAQTHYSVEVDFPDIARDQPFGLEERLHLLMRVEKSLNSNLTTKEGSATFWVRQAEPATDVITAESLK